MLPDKTLLNLIYHLNAMTKLKFCQISKKSNYHLQINHERSQTNQL